MPNKIFAMRFISLLFAALAAAAVLVTGSGQTVRVIEEERVKLINVRFSISVTVRSILTTILGRPRCYGIRGVEHSVSSLSDGTTLPH